MASTPDHPPPLVLALDTGSPVASAALARGDRVLVERTSERPGRVAGSPPAGAPMESALALLDGVLREAGVTPAALGAVCALRGPGSFTGLRIGLATALGLHQALGVRAAAMPTLRVLAEAAAGAPRVVAVVDALRGEWFVQTFAASAPARPEPSGRGRAELAPEGPPGLLGAESIRIPSGAALIGFGARRLPAAALLAPERVLEPPPLAGVAARLAAVWRDWDPALLTQPLYLRPPPVAARRGAP